MRIVVHNVWVILAVELGVTCVWFGASRQTFEEENCGKPVCGEVVDEDRRQVVFVEELTGNWSSCME